MTSAIVVSRISECAEKKGKRLEDRMNIVKQDAEAYKHKVIACLGYVEKYMEWENRKETILKAFEIAKSLKGCTRIFASDIQTVCRNEKDAEKWIKYVQTHRIQLIILSDNIKLTKDSSKLACRKFCKKAKVKCSWLTSIFGKNMES